MAETEEAMIEAEKYDGRVGFLEKRDERCVLITWFSSAPPVAVLDASAVPDKTPELNHLSGNDTVAATSSSG